MVQQVNIEACYLYPIKSCPGVPVDTLHFDSQGCLLGDRDWTVVDRQRRLRWLGDLPALVRLRPMLQQGLLHLGDADGRQPLPIPAPQHCQPCELSYWSSTIGGPATLSGVDAGDEIARFASAAVGEAIRLVHVGGRAHRPHAAHLVSSASLAELLDGGVAWQPTDLLRYRPNIVLGAAGHAALLPFIEEHALCLDPAADSACVGLLLYAPCERCITVNVHPLDGHLSPEYLERVTASTGQRQAQGGSRFGVYARARGAGQLSRHSTAVLQLDF